MKHTAQNWVALILGVVLLVIGIFGFFSNPLFGVFTANPQLNLFHILTGIAFIWCALAGLGNAANVVIGIIYFILLAVSIIEPLGMERLLAINSADDLLHVCVIALALIAGFSE